MPTKWLQERAQSLKASPGITLGRTPASNRRLRDSEAAAGGRGEERRMDDRAPDGTKLTRILIKAGQEGPLGRWALVGTDSPDLKIVRTSPLWGAFVGLYRGTSLIRTPPPPRTLQ